MPGITGWSAYNTFECAISVAQTNTTADDNHSAQWYGNLGADPGCGALEWTIHNNVGNVCSTAPGNVVVANSLNDSVNQNQSPFFVDAPKHDFHLKAGAAAIGKGDTLCPATDYEGEARPQPAGTTCDAGADEYNGTSTGGGGGGDTTAPTVSLTATEWHPTDCCFWDCDRFSKCQ
ncbi:MAG: choice-of-anchor Q domain-containing protein [Candidatus Saccharibacteria bacterium]